MEEGGGGIRTSSSFLPPRLQSSDRAESTTSIDTIAMMDIKVQFVDDRDPFAVSFPEPTRAPTFSFDTNKALNDQAAALRRFLKAPHRVSFHCNAVRMVFQHRHHVIFKEKTKSCYVSADLHL